MIPRWPILVPVLWMAAALPALAGSGHYLITQEQIAAAITSGGMPVTTDQVSLLSSVVARVAQPVLQLKSVRSDGDLGMIARLECASPAQCLPFMVALHLNNAALTSATQGLKPDQGLSKPPSLLVHAGTSAVLLLEGAHVHISVPVICLESGALGQTIRATSPDRHQYYTVQVVGQRILRGRL